MDVDAILAAAGGGAAALVPIWSIVVKTIVYPLVRLRRRADNDVGEDRTGHPYIPRAAQWHAAAATTCAAAAGSATVAGAPVADWLIAGAAASWLAQGWHETQKARANGSSKSR